MKNNGLMTGHQNMGMNIVHGTPCTDCHVAGAIGHGAVISGSEAKKIGLLIICSEKLFFNFSSIVLL